MKRIFSLILTVALVLSLATAVMAVDASSETVFDFGSESYTVAAGGELKVPVYFYAVEEPTTAISFGMMSANLFLPEGFEVTAVEKGSYVGDISYDQDGVYAFTDTAFSGSKSTPLYTVTLVAPETPDEYVLTFDVDNAFAFDEGFNLFENYSLVDATITVTEAGAAGTSIEVLDAEGINEGYTANDFTVSDTLAQFTLFAKATNAAECGIILSTEEFTKADIKEKKVWILKADDANDEGIFAVTAFENKADGANANAFEKLTSASVWACAYAIDDAGDYVISAISEY